MKRTVLLLLFCFALTIGSASATIVGSTDPSVFRDPVDWCQFGCNGVAFPTPQAWLSAGGATGDIGNAYPSEQFYNPQQGVGWSGNFAAGMGVVYNGVDFFNTPTQIAANFDNPVNGAGAYIQASEFGAFTATIWLFDINLQSLGSFSASGVSNNTPGTALFIGGYISTADVYAIQFEATGTGGFEPNFAIGAMSIGAVPEPGSLLLIAPALLGLAAVLRRRRVQKSREVI